MRTAGTGGDVRGLGIHDHLSWPFDDRADFCRHVTVFLAEGLALGLRAVYSADGPIGSLMSDVAALPGRDEHVARGALVLNVLGDLYRDGQPVDPDETLRTFAAATEEAVSLGYAGLRVAGDATSLLRTPEQVEAFARWEHKADRFMSSHPFSAVCGFDRAKVSPHGAMALACMHPIAPEDLAPFRLYAPGTDASFALAGEVDCFVAEELGAALERTEIEVRGELVVDATGLDFVDYHGLMQLRDFAKRSGSCAVLRTNRGSTGRLIGILGLQGIRVEKTARSQVA